jgi:hypothetical protein
MISSAWEGMRFAYYWGLTHGVPVERLRYTWFQRVREDERKKKQNIQRRTQRAHAKMATKIMPQVRGGPWRSALT